MAKLFSDQRRLEAARQIFGHCAKHLDVPYSVRLWDGTMVPLGRTPASDRPGHDRYVSISGPGVLGSLMRRPTLENLFRHYASGRIDLHGCDLIECMATARNLKKQRKLRLGDLRKGLPWSRAVPLFFAPEQAVEVRHELRGAEGGREKAKRSDKEFIQFHYDAGNDFYALFLDPEMLYTCAYFTDWSHSLEQAQRDKLDFICRKLRLHAGETFLDIGSGWGGLLCHAARHYGVKAQGVTLSQAQHDYTREKIARLGLEDRVKVSLLDYRNLDGSYDKISSIGMYEHVGIGNYPAYFEKIRSLLSDRGIFLNHGITRRAKHDVRKFGQTSASRKVILKYIFPGGELDHIGHSLQVMESSGFEVHDVENLRQHYGRTFRFWHDRLKAQRQRGSALIGPEKYRMWLAYLAGVTGAFEQGPLRIYQTVATRQGASTGSPLPPTRDDLYRGAGEDEAGGTL